jgi:hypothetical protein
MVVNLWVPLGRGQYGEHGAGSGAAHLCLDVVE